MASSRKGSSEGGVRRVSFSLPAETVSNLSYISRRIGVSRSALVEVLLGEPSSDLRRLTELLPPAGASEADIRRMRGASSDLVRQRVQEALSELNGAGH